jgi:pimeloyl-ACP methyl ester carboxylesterase
MKKILTITLSIIVSIYILICIVLYFVQEKLLFFPDVLAKDYVYEFAHPFEEINYPIGKGKSLNTVLFQSKEKKGIVFYLHGNGGAIDSWGTGAGLYLDNGYDVLYLDYRGYGKSDGKIHSEAQLIADAQLVYDDLKKRYAESDIIMVGTSIGTGMATQVAAKNNPKKLILNSPYASLKQLIQEKYPIVPGFLIKYKLDTKKYITQVKCPIYLFHGSEDELIPVSHSHALKAIKDKIVLTILEGGGHNGLSLRGDFQQKMAAILGEK